MKKGENLPGEDPVRSIASLAGRERVPAGFTECVMSMVALEPPLRATNRPQPVSKLFTLTVILLFILLMVIAVLPVELTGRLQEPTLLLPSLPSISLPDPVLPKIDITAIIDNRYIIVSLAGTILLTLFDRLLRHLLSSS